MRDMPHTNHGSTIEIDGKQQLRLEVPFIYLGLLLIDMGFVWGTEMEIVTHRKNRR